MFRLRRFFIVIVGAIALMFACGFISLAFKGELFNTPNATPAVRAVAPVILAATQTPVPAEVILPTLTPEPHVLVELPTATPAPLLPTATTAPVVERLIEAAPVTGEPCDEAYPDVCIPPLSVAGDLNCGDIPQFARFRVLAPDPHGFDSDGDGWGCINN